MTAHIWHQPSAFGGWGLILWTLIENMKLALPHPVARVSTPKAFTVAACVTAAYIAACKARVCAEAARVAAACAVVCIATVHI